jgi:hypothetical protein
MDHDSISNNRLVLSEDLRGFIIRKEAVVTPADHIMERLVKDFQRGGIRIQILSFTILYENGVGRIFRRGSQHVD